MQMMSTQTGVWRSALPLSYVFICQEQQCATSISFYGSGKVTMNVTSEKMGVKQGKQALNKNESGLTWNINLFLPLKYK